MNTNIREIICQECYIQMSVDLDTVELQPALVTMKQSPDMTVFMITKYNLVYTNPIEPKEGIIMKIQLKRKIMSEMMTTYFPSLLLMLITYATTFFKPFFFDAALSVNLTTMLVMTTIFISKMEGLPPTSATKMIDFWLILCQLVPFAVVVLITAIEYIREEDEEDSNSNINNENMGVMAEGVEKKAAWTAPGKRGGSKASLVLRLTGEWTRVLSSFTLHQSPETTVLPVTVLVLSAVYAAIAANFYFNFIQ